MPPQDGPAGATVAGFSSVRVGDVTVTSVYDGIVTVDLAENLIGISAADLDEALQRAFRTSPLTLSVNTFVIDTGHHRLIADTGGGGLMGPDAGKLPINLAAAGYAPEDIDRVLVTHLNGDHMGGLVVDGKPFFPRADLHVVVGEPDTELWLDPTKKDTVTDLLRDTFDAAEQMVAPYRDTGRLAPVAAGTEIVPGVRAIGTPGHTPGHLSFMIESRGERMLIWGDIVHVALVQFDRPDVAIRFDHDSPAAIKTRRRVLEDAADGRYLVAGAHLPFPGIGHVARRGGGFAYVPIDLAPSVGAVGEAGA